MYGLLFISILVYSSMPFKSQKQWKYFFANPDISNDTAREWAHETKKEFKDLPKKIKKKKKKKTAELVLEGLTNILFDFKD